jgi:hypothetical protein
MLGRLSERFRTGLALCALSTGGILIAWPSPTSAMHETDHRFIVEGHVCDQTGQPVPDAQVIVKDVRVTEGATGYTDDRGYYKTVLHLHNDNRGDKIVVKVGVQEQHTTAQFDPKDVHTERKAVVNLGTGCDQLGSASSAWIYYSIGIGVLAIVVVAGSSYLKKQRRPPVRGKGQRK